MTHRIEWDNPEKTVVLQQYLKGSTKNDLYTLAKQSADMLHSVPYTVHLIIDERNIHLVLMGADMKYLESLTPPNQGTVVMVVSETVLAYKTLIQDIGKKFAPTAFNKPYFTRTIEDARHFLQATFGVTYDNQNQATPENASRAASGSTKIFG